MPAFDGTDLSLAYGSSYDNSGSSLYGGGAGGGGGSGSSMSNPHQSMMQNPVPISQEQSPSIPKSTASHQMPPDPSYAVPDAMYASQSPKPTQMYNKNFNQSYNDSFWDRLANKKWEVFKLFIMSLIVVLGLSLHGVANHYLDKYIGSAFLTEMQEAAIRVAYPASIILFIWIVKASA
jgi:hypothetical protein